jgi:hypothetical protein
MTLWSSTRIGAAALGGVLLGADVAEARFIDLHAGLRAGGLTGQGSTSNPSRRDFFELVRGPAAGVEVGAKILVLDLSLSFMQVLGGKGEIGEPGRRLGGSAGQIGAPGEQLAIDSGLGTGTLTQLLLGFEMEFNLPRQLLLRPRLSAGFGLGTLRPVDPPLSNDDVTHKGVVAQAQVALERYLNPFLSVGVEAVAGFHYFLGGTLVVNDARNWSGGLQFGGLLTMTAHLGI